MEASELATVRCFHHNGPHLVTRADARVRLLEGGLIRVRLPPIDIAAGITVDVVSRPVVEISPRNIVASPGQYLTITVTHNSSAFNGTPPPGGPPPLQSLSVTVNGAPAKLAFVSSTPTPPAPAGTPYTTVYNSQIPMNVTYPAVVEAVALEVVGGIPSAPGVNRVRY